MIFDLVKHGLTSSNTDVCLCVYRTLPIIHLTEQTVDPTVRPLSPIVFPEVCHRGDGHHHGEGQDCDRRLESIDDGHEVQRADEQEVNIGEPVHLFKEVLGEERQPGVLGGAYLVPLVGPQPLRKLHIFWEGTHQPVLVFVPVICRATDAFQGTPSHSLEQIQWLTLSKRCLPKLVTAGNRGSNNQSTFPFSACPQSAHKVLSKGFTSVKASQGKSCPAVIPLREVGIVDRPPEKNKAKHWLSVKNPNSDPNRSSHGVCVGSLPECI